MCRCAFFNDEEEFYVVVLFLSFVSKRRSFVLL